MLPPLKCQITPLGVITHRLRITGLVCELVAARGQKRDVIQNFRCLSQVLFAIIFI